MQLEIKKEDLESKLRNLSFARMTKSKKLLNESDSSVGKTSQKFRK